MNHLETTKRYLHEIIMCPPDLITLDSKIRDDLGADSLDTVELTMAFEEEYDIEISDEEAERVVTVADIVNYLERTIPCENA